MIKRRTVIALAALIVALAAWLGAPPAAAQIAADVPLAMIEPEARAAAAQAAPDVVFTHASMEVGERGGVTVEIAGRDGAGRDAEVDLYQDGDRWVVEEIERSLTWEAAPPAVRESLGGLYGRGWRPDRIERSEREGGVVVYEVEGVDARNEAFELEMEPDGDFISLSKFNAS